MDLDFIGDKLKQFGSDVVNGTTDAFDAATHALGNVFSPGTPPGGNQSNSPQSSSTQPQSTQSTLSVKPLNNPLSLQMVNPQQQTDQSQPLKLNFGQTNQQNQQPNSLNTNLVNFTKPTQPINQNPAPLTNIKTSNMPGSFNATPHPTNQAPGAIDRFLAPVGHAITGLAGQVENTAKALPGVLKIQQGTPLINGTLSGNSKDIKQGLQQLHPIATEGRQILQSFPQEGVRLAKTVINPGTNTTPIASKNPITKFLVGNQPVQSYQQIAHNAQGGTAGKVGSVTTQAIGDVLNLLGVKAAFGAHGVPEVSEEAPVEGPPTTERLPTEQESLNQKAPAPNYEKITTRDIDAERAAQNVLQNGGNKTDAIKAYQQVHPSYDKDAAFQVSRMARESQLPLRPNERIGNPEEDNHPLPTAKPGDFKRPVVNKEIVDTAADTNLKSVNKALGKLSQADRDNFEDYLEKTKPVEDADNPGAVQDAINKGLKLTDTGNALDHAVGGTTPHIENYFPGYTDRSDLALQDSLQAEADLENQYGTDWYKLTRDKQQELIAERLATEGRNYPNDENFGGFRNMKRQFATRAERQAAGIKDQYTDPRDAYTRYAQGLKFKVGNDAFVKAAQEADQTNQIMGGKIAGKINLGGGKDTGNLTQKAYDALKDNDVNAARSTNPLLKANKVIRQSLVALGAPHAVIIPPRFLGARLALETPDLQDLLDGNVDATKPIAPKYDNAEFGARIGSPLHGAKVNAGVSVSGLMSKLPTTRFVYSYLLPKMHDSLLGAAQDYMAKRGIDPDSPEAQSIGRQINDVMGYSKQKNGVIDNTTFAPALIKSTADMYRSSVLANGTVARGGVIGQQATNQLLGFVSKAISNQISQAEGKPQNRSKDDFWSTLQKETLSPSIYTPFRNSKGEQVDLGIPGQYQADVAKIPLNLQRNSNGQLKVGVNNPLQIASNIAQTGKDIASPIVETGLSQATNQNFNGTPIRNPNAPLTTQVKQTAENIGENVVPINLQGFFNNSGNGPTALRVAANTLGLNPKADTTTGQGPAITQYYQGQTKGQDYVAAHSNNPQTQNANMAAYNQYYARSKNNQGQTILLGPKQSAANSALIASNPTALKGIQIAEKANGKGNYSPVWNLPATAAPGKPSVQTYMTYEALPKGDPNRTVLEQQNPWLVNTFNQEQTYFNSLPKTKAVQGPGYVAYPNISSQQSNIMTQVTQLASNQNRTPAQETQLENLENNPSLQTAYTLLDQYTNANRKSEGLAPIPYPTQNMTPAQQQLLDQEEALPSGTGQKSALIQANQNEWNALTQIMADSTQYAIEEYGGVVQQGGTEPNLLKDESDIGQDIAVGTNAAGQKEYLLNPALAYAGGTSSNGYTFAQGSGSGSSSSSEPFVALPKVKRFKQPKMKKPPKLRGFRAPHIRKSSARPVKVSGAHPVQVAKPTSVVKLKAA